MRVLIALCAASAVLVGLAAATPAESEEYPFAVRSGGSLSELLMRRQEETQGANVTYPTPKTDGGEAWRKGYEHAKYMVGQMTIEEKVNITTGYSGNCVGFTGEVPRLNISALCLQDGPLGMRPVRRVSQFPAEVTTAATWNHELTALRAKYMANEFKAMGVNIWLGPVSAGPLGRSVYDGRSWEGWSPDAYLNGVLTRLTVEHAQANGLMTCVKHFIGYEQETFRNQYNSTEAYSVYGPNEQSPISSNFDDRTAHEVYLWSFADAVRAGAATIMCSYNTLNGSVHACGDDETLNHYLKNELNFKGSVISDWGGTWANTDWNGGMDVTMPGSGSDQQFGSFGGAGLVDSVKNGTVSEDRITDAAIRTLAPYYALQGNDAGESWPTPGFDVRDLTLPSRGARKPEHSRLIEKIGLESFTLVKNIRAKNDTRGLPLKDKNELQSVAVVGDDAGPNLYGWTSCGQDGSCKLDAPNGTLTAGGGSGWAFPPYIIDPAAAIQQYARLGRFDVNLALTRDVESAADQANVSESALVFVNAFAREGLDRQNLTLFGDGDAIIEAVAARNNDTVVVIHSSAAVLMPWIDHPNITAVAYAYYPGQESGSSLPKLLWGETNPSGKLPFVVARNENDYLPNSIVTDHVPEPQSNFTDTLFVDYKWLAHKNTTPLFGFGLGLSYTTFDFSSLTLEESHDKDSTTVQPTNEQWDNSRGRATQSLYDALLVGHIDVTNTGDCYGKEVAQLYIEFPESVGEPARALRGFQKLGLSPGETKRASFRLSRKDLSYWSTEQQQWVIAPGKYHFHAGASSVDIHASAPWTF